MAKFALAPNDATIGLAVSDQLIKNILARCKSRSGVRSKTAKPSDGYLDPKSVQNLIMILTNPAIQTNVVLTAGLCCQACLCCQADESATRRLTAYP